MRYKVVIDTAAARYHRPANIRLGAVLLCTSYACLRDGGVRNKIMAMQKRKKVEKEKRERKKKQ